MEASPATKKPARASAQPSVHLICGARDLRDEIAEVLTAAGMRLTEEGHGVVVMACDQDGCGPAVRAVSERWTDLPIVVVIESRGQRMAVRRAVEAGAGGVIWSGEVQTALVPTIGAVCAGQLTVPLASRDELERTALTNREKQILGLVVMGFKNAEIAEKLYLAESTVKSHLSSAFNKLDVRSRNEATALILDPASGMGPGILGILSDRLGPGG